MREKALEAARFSESPHFKSSPPSSPATSASSKSSSGKKRGGRLPKSKTSISDVEEAMRIARDGVSNLEVVKRSVSFTGGVSFNLDNLNHFIVIVIGTPSETVTFDKEGGLLRAPILHPLFSLRVPKFALKEPITSTFKVVQVRKDLLESIQHFDNQLSDINECSNIYELDLGNQAFERPATLTLPLPKWYTTMIDRSKGASEFTMPEDQLEVSKHTDLEVENSEGPSGGQSAEYTSITNLSNSNNEIPSDERPKNLVLLYQVSKFYSSFRCLNFQYLHLYFSKAQ